MGGREGRGGRGKGREGKGGIAPLWEILNTPLPGSENRSFISLDDTSALYHVFVPLYLGLHIFRNVNLSMFTLDTFVLVKCTYILLFEYLMGRERLYGLRLISLCFALLNSQSMIYQCSCNLHTI